VDPAADVTVLVWRRRFDGDELLEVTDTGRTWRLPFQSEIGRRGPVVEVTAELDVARTHRWVRVDASHPDAVRAVAEAKERDVVAHLLHDEDDS
jgi:hypothetical protein